MHPGRCPKKSENDRPEGRLLYGRSTFCDIMSEIRRKETSSGRRCKRIHKRKVRETMLKQLSVFAENKRGTMTKLTGVLAREEISILGSVTNDSAEYGIIRMIVTDPEKACQALKRDGWICRLTDVIGVEITDEVGQLHKLLQAIEYSCINVDYLYLSFNRESGCPIMVLHTADAKEVENSLSAKGFALC